MRWKMMRICIVKLNKILTVMRCTNMLNKISKNTNIQAPFWFRCYLLDWQYFFFIYYSLPSSPSFTSRFFLICFLLFFYSALTFARVVLFEAHFFLVFNFFGVFFCLDFSHSSFNIRCNKKKKKNCISLYQLFLPRSFVSLTEMLVFILKEQEKLLMLFAFLVFHMNVCCCCCCCLRADTKIRFKRAFKR